jgi:hypothetical protein
MTIILTEVALYNVFTYAKLIHQLEGLSYYRYLTFLIPPFLFMLTTNIFTPEKGSDTKIYFQKQRPIFFTLLALFTSCHFLYDFGENTATVVGRLVAIAILITAGFIRKIWILYRVFILWFILLLFRVTMVST